MKKKNKKSRKKKDCRKTEMKCTVHDNDHWKTPPLWNCKYNKSEVS